MQVCLSGHVINTQFKKYPELNKPYCDKCGKKTITDCPRCNAPILGEIQNEIVFITIGEEKTPPAFCAECGNPFPWIKINDEEKIRNLEKKENPSNQASYSFTPQNIDNLAQSCIDNFLTRETAQHALRQININPALIQSSPDDRTYFTNIIEYLSSRGRLEAWLTALSKQGLIFTQEWLEK